MSRLPGPGDEATWGPCTGHPNDPRTEDDEDEEEIRTAIEECEYSIKKATEFFRAGDYEKARFFMATMKEWIK